MHLSHYTKDAPPPPPNKDETDKCTSNLHTPKERQEN